MARLNRAMFVVVCLIAGRGVASAQTGTIAGVVRDTSGGVLPGVTVEATSPALIEKTRTAVTDSQGQYRLVNLRPGEFVLTFSLQGFNTVRRENVRLSANDTVNITADLPVGALQETMTVTAQTPLVDIQSVRQHQVLTEDIIRELPSGRVVTGLAGLIPGMSGSSVAGAGVTDVGGGSGENFNSLTIHGSLQSDYPALYDGMRYNSAQSEGGGTSQNWTPNVGTAQEIVVDVGGHSAEQFQSGPQVDIVPKQGGNAFRGELYSAFTNHRLQASNINGDLLARGVADRKSYDKIWEINPSLGGPLVRDKLWFFATYRHSVVDNYMVGSFQPIDPTATVFQPDLSRPALALNQTDQVSLRLTFQPTASNKIAVFGDQQWVCRCPFPTLAGGGVSSPPQGINHLRFPLNYVAGLRYSAPLTNKLLLEAGVLGAISALVYSGAPGQPTDLTSVSELSTGVVSRALNSYQRSEVPTWDSRVKMTYVTGSQSLSIGGSFRHGTRKRIVNVNQDMNLQLLRGVPSAVQVWATPFTQKDFLNLEMGLFAQEQWTHKRLTVNMGLRFDYLDASTPPYDLAPVRFVPLERVYPAQTCVPCWNDFTPRLGVSYNLFGDGKTAVKASIGKYMNSSNLSIAQAIDPLGSIVSNTTRSWSDRNGDFVPQESELGPYANPLFGTSQTTTTFDPNYLTGRGKRGYNWEAQAAFCVTAPTDSRLPGSGSQICGFYDLNPNKVGQVRNLVTSATPYGEITQVYNGVDLTGNVRLPRGIIVQGGTSIGRTLIDNCSVAGRVENGSTVQGSGNTNTNPLGGSSGGLNPSGVASPSSLYCHVEPPFLADLKLLGIIPLPFGISASATIQSQPGPGIAASYTVTNAQVQPTLGRPLSGGRTTTSVQLIAPGTLFGDRYNEIDFRAAKTFAFGRARVQAQVDVYNLLNGIAVVGLNANYGALWLQPSRLQPGRFVKFGTQILF
jgi:hypothetical protein